MNGLRRRLHQLLRYGTVSIIASATSFVVLSALVASATLTPGWANLAATAVGTVPSFELNRRWVWGKSGRRGLGREVLPFCIMSLTGLGLSTLAVSLVGRWATGAGLDNATRSLLAGGTNVASFASLWLVQFALLDRVLFRPQAEVAAPPAPGLAPKLAR